MAPKKFTKKVVASGISDNLRQAMDAEWTATERSDKAEQALLREYHYHALRADELREFLMGCGIIMPGWED